MPEEEGHAGARQIVLDGSRIAALPGEGLDGFVLILTLVNRSIDMGIVDKYSRAIAVLLGNHDFIELDGPFIALVKMCEFDPANVRLAVFRRVEEERVIMQVHDAKHPRTIRLEKVAAAVPAVELDRTDLPFDINQETVPLRVN